MTLKLYPGWATKDAGQRWTLDAQVRLYGDDAEAKALPSETAATLTLPPGQPQSVSFAPVEAPWVLPEGFVSLLRYSAVQGTGIPWTRESPLLAAPTPLMR